MNFLGVDGYRAKQRAVTEARAKVEAGVKKLGFRVLGRPQLGIVSFSHDRADALTRAKKGETIKAQNCGPTPVARQYQLGHKLNMRGTPGIFTAHGDYVTGYLPAKQLVQQLKSFEAK